VPRVAIVTDSASDLPPDVARETGITVVPLIVSFGEESFKAGVELSTDAFWERMLAPGAPFPTTAAASPGDFHLTFQACFDQGADAIVCVNVGSELSGTIKSARIGRDMLPDREIHVIDSRSASMAVGLLAEMGAEMAATGETAGAIAAELERRIADVDLYLTLDTLEYLKKGGRISPATAAIGGLLSFKPLITVRDGKVETAERVRTRGRAVERTVELLTRRPIERLAVLFTPGADVDSFRAAVVARAPGGIDPDRISVEIVGPSVGPHVGPGCIGAVVLYGA
jgi:DegV family protein with EDD domain